MTSNSLEQRDRYLDALKGVGIFLMIIGHVMSPIRNMIFSFHMPLFFFISGYLYKDRDTKNILVRNAKKVLLPYTLTCLFIWLCFVLKDQNWQWGISILLANGTDSVWGFEGLMVGPLWFLVCYMDAILGLHYVLMIKEKIIQLLVILSLWILAYIIKIKFGLQPLDILNAAPAMCCLWMGYCLKEEKIEKVIFSIWAFIAGIAIWVICLLYGNLSMAGLTYKLWLLQLIGAFYATAVLYKMLSAQKLRGGGQVFTYFGQLSLVILCVHTVDYMLNISNIIVKCLGVPNLIGIPLNMILKLLFATIGTIIVRYIPFINRIYLAK